MSVGHWVSDHLGILSTEWPLFIACERPFCSWLPQKWGGEEWGKAHPSLFVFSLQADGECACYACGRAWLWNQFWGSRIQCYCFITGFNPCFPHGILTTSQCIHLKWVGLPVLTNADKMVTIGTKSKGLGTLLGSSSVARLLHKFDALSPVCCFAYQNDLFYLCLPRERPQEKVFLRQYKKCEEGLIVISLIRWLEKDT